jgi:hypothetical protein
MFASYQNNAPQQMRNPAQMRKQPAPNRQHAGRNQVKTHAHRQV